MECQSANCVSCGSVGAKPLPRDSRVWLEVGKWEKEKGSDDSKIVLRGTNSFRFEISKSDLMENDSRMLMRNTARVYRMKELNPGVKASWPCASGSYPNYRYLNDTECKYFILTCIYCTYNEFGQFAGEESEICGVCTG